MTWSLVWWGFVIFMIGYLTLVYCDRLLNPAPKPKPKPKPPLGKASHLHFDWHEVESYGLPNDDRDVLIFDGMRYHVGYWNQDYWVSGYPIINKNVHLWAELPEIPK